MKALIVYDSFFGNTEKVARAIAGAFGSQESAGVLKVSEVKPEHLQGIDLLIVGSPTRAFQPTEAIRAFLKNLSPQDLKGVKVAAFDTRINAEETNSSILRIMVKIFGYAASPIAKRLQNKGGNLALPPEGFYVKESEGPLKEGELERARDWVKPVC